MNNDTLLNNAREIIKALRAKWIADGMSRAECAPEPIWQHYAGTAMRPDLYSCEAQYVLADCLDAGLWREII